MKLFKKSFLLSVSLLSFQALTDWKGFKPNDIPKDILSSCSSVWQLKNVKNVIPTELPEEMKKRNLEKQARWNYLARQRAESRGTAVLIGDNLALTSWRGLNSLIGKHDFTDIQLQKFSNTNTIKIKRVVYISIENNTVIFEVEKQDDTTPQFRQEPLDDKDEPLFVAGYFNKNGLPVIAQKTGDLASREQWLFFPINETEVLGGGSAIMDVEGQVVGFHFDQLDNFSIGHHLKNTRELIETAKQQTCRDYEDCLNQAVSSLEAKAEQGDSQAMYTLALIYKEGLKGVIPKDETKFFKLIKESAKNNNPKAFMVLADTYKHWYDFPSLPLEEEAKQKGQDLYSMVVHLMEEAVGRAYIPAQGLLSRRLFYQVRTVKAEDRPLSHEFNQFLERVTLATDNGSHEAFTVIKQLLEDNDLKPSIKEVLENIYFSAKLAYSYNPNRPSALDQRNFPFDIDD